jgi:hypothetical protein
VLFTWPAVLLLIGTACENHIPNFEADHNYTRSDLLINHVNERCLVCCLECEFPGQGVGPPRLSDLGKKTTACAVRRLQLDVVIESAVTSSRADPGM